MTLVHTATNISQQIFQILLFLYPLTFSQDALAWIPSAFLGSP